MEALWNLEDKWRLTTQEAFVVFLCTAFAVIGLCAVTMIKRRKKKMVTQVESSVHYTETSISWSETNNNNHGKNSSRNWMTIRRLLMESMRWSEANKWEEIKRCVRSNPPPLLAGFERCDSSGIGWQSHNSVSPVWQRPILMGEKCELPRFSGLILYDERGRLLSSSRDQNILHHQEKPPPVLRTTLKDLL